MGLPPSVQGAGRPIIGLPPWESGFPCSHWLLHIIRREVSKMASFFSQIFLLWIFDTVVFSFQPYIIANWFYTSLPIKKKQLREENSISPVMLLCADAWNARQCKDRQNSQLKTFWSEAPPILSRRSIFSEMKVKSHLNRSSIALAFATRARKLESANILIS